MRRMSKLFWAEWDETEKDVTRYGRMALHSLSTDNLKIVAKPMMKWSGRLTWDFLMQNVLNIKPVPPVPVGSEALHNKRLRTCQPD